MARTLQFFQRFARKRARNDHQQRTCDRVLQSGNASYFRPRKTEDAASIQLFSTCPSSLTTPDHYVERVEAVSRWSEKAGCTGILVYTDNTLVDPWMVSQIIIQSTHSLSPLVAVQPIYMHPYSVAKMVWTAGVLYGRRMFLKMVAGGFKNDLIALGDATPHDSRYQRLVEYTLIIQQLLDGHAPVTMDGQFYKVNGLKLNSRLAPELRPGILVSGSSAAGLAAAREMGATPVKYPEPLDPDAVNATHENNHCGVRIGIVARARESDAWAVAHERFPADRKGQLTRQLANKVSDSAWHKQLAEIGKEEARDNGAQRGPYWLHPFENYQTNCPYLVGSYETVANELGKYINTGYRTFILDIPPTEEELDHVGVVFEAARQGLPEATRQGRLDATQQGMSS